MARSYIFVLLSTIMAVSHFNIAQGSPRFSLPKTGRDHVPDFINEARGDATPTVENFRNLIEKHAKEIQEFRSLHPDLDGNAQLSSRFHEIIESHINGALNNYINKRIDENTDAKHDASPIVENFSKLIEKQVAEIKKFRSQHPDIDSNKQVSSRIHEILQGYIKRAVSTHIRNKLGEFIHSARLSTPTRHAELIDTGSLNVIHHDARTGNKHSENRAEENRNDRPHKKEGKSREEIQALVHDITGKVKEMKSAIREKVTAKKALIESELSKKFDMLREVATKSRQHEFDGVIDSAQGVARGDFQQALRNMIQEKFRAIGANTEASKQAFNTARQEMNAAAQKLHGSSNADVNWSHDNNQGGKFDKESLKAFNAKLQEMILKKAQYIKEQVLLRQNANQMLNNQILAHSKSPSSASVGVDVSAHGVARGDFLPALRDMLQEKLISGANTEASNAAGQALNAAGQASNAAGQASNAAGQASNAAGQASNAAGQASNAAGQALNAAGQEKNAAGQKLYGYDSKSPSSASADVDATAESADTQSLEMAAVGNGGSDDGDDDGGSSTAVVLSVLACLVISAAVGVFAVVMWKKHRRQRMYVRIPSGQPVPTPD